MANTSEQNGDERHPAVLAAFALSQRHDPEPEHALHVSRLALMLFDQTVRLHHLGARERILLEAAAIMHDTGYGAGGVEDHHKRSRDIVMAQRIEGLSPEEQQMTACVVRYHRGSSPKPTHKVFRDLSMHSRDIVGKLAALLRIADGLDRSHAANVTEIRVELRPKGLDVHVTTARPASVDIEAARAKCGLYTELTGLAVRILPGRADG